MLKKLPDSFAFGLLLGLVTLSIAYLLMRGIRMAIVNYYGNPYMFAAPKAQLFAIVLNLLVFRFTIVDLEKEKAGKGILFTTVILSLAYFFLFLRYNFTAV